MISLPCKLIALSFGQRLRVCTGDRCCTRKNATLKEPDTGQDRMREGCGKQKLFEMFVCAWLAGEIVEKGDTRRREWTCVAIVRRMGGRPRCL